MGLVIGNGGYDRSRILERARRAQAKKRPAEAIALYRRVLIAEPGNAEIHGKLGPLLARTGQEFDAWLSFRTAARAHLRQREIDRALAVYREAARHLPREIEAWQAIACLERRRGRPRDAAQVLRQGFRHFRSRALRAQGIYLLRLARAIDPRDPDAALDLARLLGRAGRRDEELALLEELARRCRGRALRRVCAARLRSSPTPGHLWGWLRCALSTGAGATS